MMISFHGTSSHQPTRVSLRFFWIRCLLFGNTRRQGNRASDRAVRNMLNCAWLESCYEPACAGAAFSQGRRRVELWLGAATAITQARPAPAVEQIALNIQDAASTPTAPCMPFMELPARAAACALFAEYGHSLLRKRKRSEDMETEDRGF